MTTQAQAKPAAKAAPRAVSRGTYSTKAYPHWFYLPAGAIYVVLFIVPTIFAFYFSLTRWDLVTSTFIGLDNYAQFFSEPALTKGLVNTLVYAVVTSASKVVLGLLLAVLLTSGLHLRDLMRSVIFFPVLVSTIGVGLTATIINPVAFSYGYDRLRFVKPVFIGDTIRSRVETIAAEPMEKRPGFGRVTERLTVTNQKDETVLVADHIYMVERQP